MLSREQLVNIKMVSHQKNKNKASKIDTYYEVIAVLLSSDSK